MITIELIINNQSVKVSKSGSLYHQTFKATDPKQSIKIPHLGCFGDTEITQIQLEKGTEPTYFTKPSWTEYPLSGLFEDMRALKVELKDSESELWGRITANAKGILAEYHEKEFKSALALTAEQFTAQLEDSEALAQRVMRANVYQTTIKSKDNALESRLTQLQEGFNTKVTDLENKASSDYTQLSTLIQQKVTRQDVEAIIGNSGDAIYLTIKDKIPDSKMTASEIKSALNLSRDGVRIQGNNIMLDGNSYISSGVIKDAHIGSLNASKINAGTINAANVRIINLDINNLTGNRADFIQTYWNGINSRISIDANGLTAMHRDGSKTIINAQGLYTQVGGTNYHTHYLMHIEEVSNVLHDGSSHANIIDPLGVNPNHYWVDLPAVFRGKRFKAIASISDTMTFNSPDYSSGRLQLLRTVCYVDRYDYANARVGLVGYAHVYEPSRGKRWNYPSRAMVSVTY